MKNKLSLLTLLLCLVAIGVSIPARSQEEHMKSREHVTVEVNGTVQIPPVSIPNSTFLSPAAKAYVTKHLQEMQDPYLVAQVNGVPRFMKPFLEYDRKQFSVSLKQQSIGGVPVYIYTPKSGITSGNRTRVLINLHGGGFSGCWPACAELESIPIAALMRIKVITVNYREGPKYKFPAASEDVADVYKQLLKTYRPQNIGIYGCSAGGMLTAESMAWFQVHRLPNPGAIGVYCAGAANFGGGFQLCRHAYWRGAYAISCSEALCAATCIFRGRLL